MEFTHFVYSHWRTKKTIMRYELIPILSLVAFLGGHQNTPSRPHWRIYKSFMWEIGRSETCLSIVCIQWFPHLRLLISPAGVSHFSLHVIWSLECNSCPQITLPGSPVRSRFLQRVGLNHHLLIARSRCRSARWDGQLLLRQVSTAPPGVTVADIKPLRHRKTLTLASRLWKLQVYLFFLHKLLPCFDLSSSLRMDLHGRALLLLLSSLTAFGANVTEDGSLDKIGKVLCSKWHNH